MIMEKHIVYTTEIDEQDLEEARIEIVENFKDNPTKEEIRQKAYELNELNLDDARGNIRCGIKNVGKIAVIADLGTWKGRFMGYKILNSVNDMLYSEEDDFTLYGDGKDMRADTANHDASSSYLYREITDMDKFEKLAEKIYDQKDYSPKELNFCTRSLYPYFQKLYGWK